MTEKIDYKYTADTKGYTSAIDSAESKNKSFNKSILGIGTAVVAGGAGMFKMADMASDLNEAMNVVTATMGDSADEIIAWSETSISAMGISQTEALKTAGTFGSMGKALGLTVPQASSMAMELTQLSADMASFYNVSQEVAATSLKGIFTGETEALKQFGIMIDTTTLKQYGYNDNMTQAEKIMVRYKAVMDQTKDVQGDFARTSDGMSNQTRIAQEQFKQLATEIGAKLLPTMTELVRTLNSGLSVAIALVSGDTANLSQEQMGLYNTLKTILPIIGALAKVVAVLAVAYASWTAVMAIANGISAVYNGVMAIMKAETIAMALAQLGLDLAMLPFIGIALLVIAGIVALIAVLLNWGNITTWLSEKWATFTTWLSTLWSTFTAWAVQLWTSFTTWLANVWTVVKATWEAYWLAIYTYLQIIWTNTAIMAQAIWDSIKVIINNVWELIKTIITSISTAIFDIIKTWCTSIYTYITTIWNTIKQFFSDIWNAIKSIFSGVLAVIQGIVTGDFNLMKQGIESIWNGIKGFFQAIWNAIQGIFSAGLNLVKSITIGTFNAISSGIQGIWNGITGFFSSTWESIKSIFSNAVSSIYDNTIGRFQDMASSIMGIFSSIGSAVSAINPFDSPTAPEQGAYARSAKFGSPVPSALDQALAQQYSFGNVGGSGLSYQLFGGSAGMSNEVSNNDNSMFNVTFENIEVRSDSDINAISENLEKLYKKARRGGGNK